MNLIPEDINNKYGEVDMDRAVWVSRDILVAKVPCPVCGHDIPNL